ncbi:hypothetical protein MHK_007642 [Candidatus Magnetomorum sp. HK-1]|nr:hypothetical protein MHK_007642 [Candidatus Magnetomorum sp. HK-1]
MAKQLIFKSEKMEHPCDIVRLDRKKLYGWKDVVAMNTNGEECIRVDIDETGSFIIPKGGKALGSIDINGNWVEKSDLKAIDKTGAPAVRVPSSFDAPIALENKVDLETFLDHVIDSVYIIQPSEDIKKSLIKIIQSNDMLYTFPFNYRPDYDPKTAFLIEARNIIYMLVGTPSAFEFIGMEQMADLNVEDTEEEFSIEDDLDFSMM